MDFELTARESARLDSAVAVMTAVAKEAGLSASPEMLRDLPSVRIAVLSADSLNTESAMRELQQMPSIAAQLRQQALDKALADGDSDLHEELARMSPARRLSVGHRLEANKPKPEAAPQISPEIEAERIKLLSTLNPQQRLNQARAWGLI